MREWEVLGSELLYLFNEEARPELDRIIARAIISDVKSAPATFERRTADGRPQFVEVTASGLRSRTDEPGATVLLQDVTTRVLAEHIGLPGLEGHEVSRSLRARAGRHPFLIALTGYSQPDDRRRAEEAGFNAYLVKPVPVDDLIRLLAGLPRR